MVSRFSFLCCWFLFVYCSGASTNQGTKRSADFPTFQEILISRPESFKISGAECTFNKDKDGCPKTYKAEGTCHLSSVSSQLFPDVNIEDSTNKFIVPAKFQVGRMEIFACEGDAKNGMVSFVARSVESVELVPQQLTLGAETRLKLSWNTLETFNPEKLEVKLKGFTSIGSETRVELEVEKATDGADYILDFKLATLNVNNFLAKFEVDASQMISPDLSFASSRMGLATLVLQEPKIDGLYSPGGGFEIVATGTITAPELPADANKFYLIVQDFKQGSSDSANGGYGKPIAAVFALYKNERVRNAISSLTRLNVPGLAMFRGTNEVAITVATKQLFNINSRKLRELANKYVPIEGMDMIPTGLTVMHYSRNSNSDIKDKDKNTAERVLFRAEVTKEGLTWTSPQRIETQMSSMAAFVWSLRDCQESLSISPGTKGVFVDIKYAKTEDQMEVSFNLTERVPVLSNGLVSLLNSTITLFSQEKTEDCSWQLRGEGKETILDELVDVTISQTEHRTFVRAEAQIFDMQTLMNRTQAKPFNERYEEAFPFLQTLPFQDLRYEATFQFHKVLKFKGFALVDGKPNVELIYYMIEGKPQLKLGFHFRRQHLYKVVNMFYRADKIKSTWIKFESICIIVKNQELSVPMQFDRKCIANADKSFTTAGIGFFADQLIASDCDGEKWKICNFLKTYMGDVLNMNYVGQMLPEKITMITRAYARFDLTTGMIFYKDQTVSKLDSTNGGDRLSFEANVHLTRTFDMFPAKIYDDGNNKIMLKFAFDPNKASVRNGRDLLAVSYARMDPVRSHFELPATSKVEKIEFQSPLKIGSVEAKQVKFGGNSSRQFLWYSTIPDDFDARVRFVGERDRLKLKNLLHAFDLPDTHKLLKNAEFENQVVAGYTSMNEVWEVPDLNLKVKKGLHFYGKLTLKTKETYESTINLLSNMQLQTIIHLTPLRYGKMANDSNGKPTFQFVNLFLHKDSERPELGPNLICEGQTQYLQGYAETVGLEGEFRSDTLSKGDDDLQHQIRMRGNLYKEVENAEVILTTDAEDRPKDFKFQYQVDITEQGKANVNNHLRDVLSDIKKDAKKGRDTAQEIVNDVREQLDSYKAKRERYLNEMKSVEDQIHNINSDVDLAMIDISTDCIDQCKTVAMPGIEWKQECLDGAGGQRNMKCMTWSESKERVVNVICVLKCEAKKMTAAGEAASSLEEIRLLVNRYREQKVFSQNIGKITELIEQGYEIANSAKELVDSKTDIKEEVDGLLAVTGDLVTINMLKVDTDLESISPPCPPFQLDFTLKTARTTTHNGVFPICFNGEFYKNVGLRIIRVRYPAIDAMYKALEEAELRYARIGAIKKSLQRVQEDVRKESKRGKVSSPPEDDPVEGMLTKIAKRRIPTFTLKGDKTMLGFHHYSPWATIKRSNPFDLLSEPSYHRKYDRSNLHGKSACHQTKEIISQYKHITENLEHLSSNYNHGKNLFGKSKTSIMKDLENSHSEIRQLMNRTKLSHAERRDMMHWYQFTKHGMNDYLQTFSNRLAKQNKRSLTYLRNELSSFYGTENFVDHLREVGSNAISRSTISGAKRSKQINTLADVGKELKRVLFNEMTLDHAGAAIQGIKGDIESLYQSAATCY